MAVFSKWTVLLLLASLLLISLAVRYPLVEHERQQTDSYYIHHLSQSIIDDRRAVWAFNPLSYFGYYPYSYPSGIPFLFAEFSALTGLSVEVTILVCDIVFAAIFLLGAFLMARQFISRPEYVLLATAFAVFGSRFIDTTYWGGSARGPLVVIMLLVILASFRASSMRQNRLVGIAVVLALGCFVTHHMAVLLILFGLGYALAVFQIHYLIPRFRSRRTSAVAAFSLSTAGLILIVAYVFFEFFGKLALMNLQKSSLFDIDPPILSVLLNMATSYTNQIGFILFFALLSVPRVLRARGMTTEMLFMVTLLIAFIPLLAETLYVSMLLAPFASILGTIWFIQSFARRKRRTVILCLVFVMLISSAALPIWSTQRWNSREYLSGDTVEVRNEIFSDATYLAYNYDGEFAVSNVNAMTSVFSAFTEVRFMASGIPAVLNGDVTRDQVAENITRSKSPFPMNLYTWFEHKEEWYMEYYKWALIVGGLSYLSDDRVNQIYREYYSAHDKLLVSIDNSWSNHYIDTYVVVPAKFPAELRNAAWESGTSLGRVPLESYMIYASQRTSTFVVELPF